MPPTPVCATHRSCAQQRVKQPASCRSLALRTATHPVICKLLPARSCFPLSRGSRQQLTFHGVMRATSQVVLRIKQRQQAAAHRS